MIQVRVFSVRACATARGCGHELTRQATGRSTAAHVVSRGKAASRAQGAGSAACPREVAGGARVAHFHTRSVLILAAGALTALEIHAFVRHTAHRDIGGGIKSDTRVLERSGVSIKPIESAADGDTTAPQVGLVKGQEVGRVLVDRTHITPLLDLLGERTRRTRRAAKVAFGITGVAVASA